MNSRFLLTVLSFRKLEISPVICLKLDDNSIKHNNIQQTRYVYWKLIRRQIYQLPVTLITTKSIAVY